MDNHADVSKWPQNVGIVAIEIYFPAQFVDQVRSYADKLWGPHSRELF
jgi:hypothetical protein